MKNLFAKFMSLFRSAPVVEVTAPFTVIFEPRTPVPSDLQAAEIVKALITANPAEFAAAEEALNQLSHVEPAKKTVKRKVSKKKTTKKVLKKKTTKTKRRK